MPRIELRNINFTYPGQERPVLEGLDFAFNRGRIGLTGDNGSGKTTLLHIMTGLLRPDNGEVRFNGRVLRHEEDFFPLRRQVGMLFQQADDQLFCPSVLEDVAFGPLNLGLSPREARKRSMAMLDRLGIGAYGDRITHRLSGGEKRLVALAAVLVMEPAILLLDEPTNDLDREGYQRLLAVLRDLEISLIIVSHDWDFLGQLCQHFYILEKNGLVRSEQVRLHTHHHAHLLGDRHHRHQS